ncbi:DUF1064 domain-containing protein [Mesoterricola silvestris]|uniref:DUF1064 domain-containing protein n=1 Tax=Mesoterricola silvestris TaxID=2927979 RepID=A0AA48GM43_9BACT|nr:DUF1064 domain-containing protein [Mesoterricola silvestris]BDU72359.1 hypothetical protein METEAL_15330 [Mesoterricola silvestris]
MNAPSKYKNVRTNGFASKREAKRAFELQLLERAGEITDLKMQVPFEVVPSTPGERPVFYVADFVYLKGGNQVVEDVKGVRTDVYKIKRKLMAHVYGIQIQEVA